MFIQHLSPLFRANRSVDAVGEPWGSCADTHVPLPFLGAGTGGLGKDVPLLRDSTCFSVFWLRGLLCALDKVPGAFL